MEMKCIKTVYKRMFTVLFIVGAIAVSCTHESRPEKEKDPVNPNGDSELAVTMREMMAFSKQLKTEIENNEALTPYPESIRKILTAKETEGMIKDRSVYTGFASHYLSSLDSVYTGGQVTEHFNGMVNSCVSCHSNYCQGPIPAIKKLYLVRKQ